MELLQERHNVFLANVDFDSEVRTIPLAHFLTTSLQRPRESLLARSDRLHITVILASSVLQWGQTP